MAHILVRDGTDFGRLSCCTAPFWHCLWTRYSCLPISCHLFTPLQVPHSYAAAVWCWKRDKTRYKCGGQKLVTVINKPSQDFCLLIQCTDCSRAKAQRHSPRQIHAEEGCQTWVRLCPDLTYQWWCRQCTCWRSIWFTHRPPTKISKVSHSQLSDLVTSICYWIQGRNVHECPIRREKMSDTITHTKNVAWQCRSRGNRVIIQL